MHIWILLTGFFYKTENSKYARKIVQRFAKSLQTTYKREKKLAIKMLINRNDISHQNLPNDDSEALRTVIVSSGPNGQWASISDI